MQLIVHLHFVPTSQVYNLITLNLLLFASLLGAIYPILANLGDNEGTYVKLIVNVFCYQLY